MLHRKRHFSQMHGELKILMSYVMLNAIQRTYRASNRLQRLKIRFVIGESPVPRLTGKMQLGENKLIMLPAPSRSSVLIRAPSEQLSEMQKADCAAAVLGNSISG